MSRVRRQQQRGTVRFCPRDGIGGNQSAGSRLVLDHKGLAERVLQMRSEETRGGVGLAARCEWSDDGDGARRIGLRDRLCGGRRQHRDRQQQQQQAACRPATSRHRVPPLLVPTADMTLGRGGSHAQNHGSVPCMSSAR